MTSEAYMADYLKRINDLDNPLPEDSKIFLPARPDNPAQEYVKTSVKVNLAGLSEDDKHRLREEYFACVEQPATETLDTFPSDSVITVLDGKVGHEEMIFGGQ